MKNAFLVIAVFLACSSIAQTRTIHVFVALCDNVNQGIVPVPQKLGNGQDPASNLYWGALYGVKTYFKSKTSDWIMVAQPESDNPNILDRILFKHATEDVYLLTEAYDGAAIYACIEDFLKCSNGQDPMVVKHKGQMLNFGGNANLLAYVGHDGLMEFDVNIDYQYNVPEPRDVIILACYSRNYFDNKIIQAEANPLLWTTGLMAPEAYVLKAAIDGWLRNESGEQIDVRAGKSYQKYQKCSQYGADILFTTGYNY